MLGVGTLESSEERVASEDNLSEILGEATAYTQLHNKHALIMAKKITANRRYLTWTFIMPFIIYQKKKESLLFGGSSL
jgi:hypothetical protein